MDLYQQLNLQPVRTEPDVWVRRLVIYEQIVPEPVVIREVLLALQRYPVSSAGPKRERLAARLRAW